jgi:hypothetical protein
MRQDTLPQAVRCISHRFILGPRELASNGVYFSKTVVEELFHRFGHRNMKTPASLPRSVNEFCD